MPFSRTACLALVYFDKEILTYTSKFCNRENGLQPLPCKPKQKILVWRKNNKGVSTPLGELMHIRQIRFLHNAWLSIAWEIANTCRVGDI